MARSSLDPYGGVSTSSDVEKAIGAFIHAWTPHNTLTLTGVSIVVFLAAVLIASCSRKTKALSVNDWIRVGFAAGPIPIYLLLPLVPYDRDLINVLLDQPFQLLIAAVVGLIWTFADIARIIKGQGSRNGNPNSDSFG